jgi:mycothiol system anti-sigma-R factor
LSCQRAQDLIHPYVDGELDILQAAEVERHLDQCEDCNDGYRNQISLRSFFKDISLYHRAPQDLKQRIRSSLQKEVKE